METPEYVTKMDETAKKLLERIDDDKTSDVQKGRLFAQVMAWYKVRKTLVPDGAGEGLKEMANELKSQTGGGSGSAGSKSGAAKSGSKDGKAIRAIIRSLPSYGGRARGDQADPERPGGRDAGNDRGDAADGGGDVSGDVAGARNSGVV